jgi:hypothetical protein
MQELSRALAQASNALEEAISSHNLEAEITARSRLTALQQAHQRCVNEQAALEAERQAEVARQAEKARIDALVKLAQQANTQQQRVLKLAENLEQKLVAILAEYQTANDALKETVLTFWLEGDAQVQGFRILYRKNGYTGDAPRALLAQIEAQTTLEGVRADFVVPNRRVPSVLEMTLNPEAITAVQPLTYELAQRVKGLSKNG